VGELALRGAADRHKPGTMGLMAIDKSDPRVLFSRTLDKLSSLLSLLIDALHDFVARPVRVGSPSFYIKA